MFLNNLNKAFLCLTFMLCSFVYSQDATLSFGNVDIDNSSMEILMDTDVEVGGFQFALTGVTLTANSAVGGQLSNDAGFSVSNGDNIVLGFSFSGGTIPAGSSGALATVNFTADADATESCLADVVFSDAAGLALDVATGACATIVEPVLGCTDMAACNYDDTANTDDGSCTYAEENYDCDGNCTAEVDCNGVCAGDAVEDCEGECNGSAMVDDCGICGGTNSTGCVASLSLGSFDEITNQFDILIQVGADDLAGFQFTVSGFEGSMLIPVDVDGLALSNGFSVSAGATGIVIGFSFSGTVIPAGSSGVLTTLMGTPSSSTACLSFGPEDAMASATGESLDYAIENDCIATCTDVDGDLVCDDVDDCVGAYDDCGICNGDGTTCLNTIYFGDVVEGTDSNTMDVWLSTASDTTAVPVAGLQFNVLGADLTGFSGGLADLGWEVSHNETTALVFSLTGLSVPVDSLVLLTTFSFDISDFEACLDFGAEGAISDSNGGELPSATGACYTYMTAVGGCTDMDACNYNADANADDGSCTYAEGTCDCNGDPTDDYCDCNGNMLDECDVCGGDGPEENYDCDGNCTAEIDCAGVCGGDSELDECGVCDGDGIADGACDCDGNVEDCAGECGGTAVEDECGECNGDGASYECSDGTIVCDISYCATNIEVSFGSLTQAGDWTYSLEVLYSSTESIAGFQWTTTGPLLVGAAGGAAEDAGFEVSTSELGIIIGFSLTGATISAGEGVLTNLWIQGVAGETEACLTDVIISDTAGGAFDEVTVGACTDVGDTLSNGEIPSDYSLSQNYPNPFNPVTNIEFSIADPGEISLKVYDISGKEVSELANGFYVPGNYNIKWDAIDSNGNELSSGVYIYQLNTKNGILSNRMVLMR